MEDLCKPGAAVFMEVDSRGESQTAPHRAGEPCEHAARHHSLSEEGRLAVARQQDGPAVGHRGQSCWDAGGVGTRSCRCCGPGGLSSKDATGERVQGRGSKGSGMSPQWARRVGWGLVRRD